MVFIPVWVNDLSAGDLEWMSTWVSYICSEIKLNVVVSSLELKVSYRICEQLYAQWVVMTAQLTTRLLVHTWKPNGVHSGTVLVEGKSGYGLDTETEMKMLRVLERAKRELPIDISSTYCGAHAVPK